MCLCRILHALILRREASKTRDAAIARRRDKLTIVEGEESESKRSAQKVQLRATIAKIESERSGAFRPVKEDYIFRALAIPFTGTGGLLLLDLLSLDDVPSGSSAEHSCPPWMD